MGFFLRPLDFLIATCLTSIFKLEKMGADPFPYIIVRLTLIKFQHLILNLRVWLPSPT